MKRGTTDHPKIDAICSLLKIGKAQAVGHLELLWHFTARYAIQGDVGKHSDSAIATRCGWGKDPAKFISALIDAGWVEHHAECRLLIHDWHDHADQSTKKTLHNKGLEFIPSMDGNFPSKSIQVGGKSSPTSGYGYGSGSGSGKAKATAPAPALDAGFEAFWTAWPKHPRKAGKSQCLAKWIDAGLDENAPQIMVVLAAYKRSDTWAEEGGKYIPAPLPWLNQAKYDADPADIASPLSEDEDDFGLGLGTTYGKPEDLDAV